MNREIEVLREVVVKVTKLLAGQSIQVTQRGAQAYARADKTGKPYLVNIPYIPNTATPGFLAAIQGFIDHEVGHILFTDWSVQRIIKGNAKLHSCWNIVEDPFIERCIAKKFPGTAYNLDKVYGYFLEHITIPALEKAENEMQEFGVLLVPVIRALSGQAVFDRWLKENGHYDHPLIKTLLQGMAPTTLASLPKLKTSHECLAVAREMHAIIHPPKSVAPPAPPPPPAAPPSDEPKPGHEGKPEEDEEDPGKTGAGEPDPKAEEKPEGEEHATPPAAEDDEPGEGASGEEKAEETEDDDARPVGLDDDENSAEEAESDGPAEDEGHDEAEGELEDEAKDDGFDEDFEGSGSRDKADEDGDEEADGEESGSASDGAGDEGDGEDEDDGSKPEESKGGMGSSSFETEEADLTAGDFEKALADHLTTVSTDAARGAPYLVYSRDFDKIARYEPAPEFRDSWLISLDDKVGKMVGVMQKDIERMMAARSRVMHVPGFRSGRLHAGSLHRLTTGDDRVFRRRQESKSKETAVTLLIDNSGSMNGPKMETAMQIGYALSLTLERVGIKHEVMGFTTLHVSRAGGLSSAECEAESERIGKEFTRYEPLYMPIFKDFTERLNPAVKKRFADAINRQHFLRNNVDGECIEIAAKRLLSQFEARKVLIVLSDGSPAAYTHEPVALYEDCAKAVRNVTAMGVETIGIGVMTDAVTRFYPKHVVLHRIADLPKMVMGHLSAILLAA